MLRKFRITVDGKPYDVTVEDMTDDGATLYPAPSMTQRTLEPTGEPTRTAAAAPPAAAPAPSAAGPGDGDEVSPLAGVVVAVEVSVGQAVSEGDKIVTIEAMKMKTAVVAHRSGSVSAIAVKAGDGVEAGQVLLTIS